MSVEELSAMPSARMIILTSTLIIMHITLHPINVYFISHLDNSIIIYICNMSLDSSPCIDRSLFCIFIIICITLYFLFMQAQFKQMNSA